jgi:hypothetical protein
MVTRLRQFAAATATALVALCAGCAPPGSECSSDEDCPAGQACKSLAQASSTSGSTGQRVQIDAPAVGGASSPEDILTVTADSESISVNDSPVVEVPVSDESLREQDSHRIITPLQEAVEREWDLARQEAKLMGEDFRPSVRIGIDRSARAGLARRVARTLEQAGADKLTWAVAVRQDAWIRRAGNDGEESRQ